MRASKNTKLAGERKTSQGKKIKNKGKRDGWGFGVGVALFTSAKGGWRKGGA